MEAIVQSRSSELRLLSTFSTRTLLHTFHTTKTLPLSGRARCSKQRTRISESSRTTKNKWLPSCKDGGHAPLPGRATSTQFLDQDRRADREADLVIYVSGSGVHDEL
eukprot:2557982-Rhodomonas_salina.4